MANNNNNNVIFEDEVTLTVTKKSFVNKQTGEQITYNELKIAVLGEEFTVKLNDGDKKLFKYLLGDR